MNEKSVYDVKSREEWQVILDKVQHEIGMFSAVLDAQNQILQTSGERNNLCWEIVNHESAKPVICGQSQQYMAQMARSGKKPVVEVCEGGLAKLVVPILQDQDYVGAFTSCGAIFPGEEIEIFFIDKNTHMGEEAIQHRAKTVPVIERERLQRVAESLMRKLSIL